MERLLRDYGETMKRLLRDFGETVEDYSEMIERQLRDN